MENSELIQLLRTVMQEELKPIKEDISNIKQDVSNIKDDVFNLKQDMSNIKEDVSNLKQDMSIIKEDVANLKQDVSNIKGQLDENTRFIKSLMHRTEELSAQFDGLLNTTVTKECISNLATKEDLDVINAKLDALNTRIFYQDTEISRLKAVK